MAIQANPQMHNDLGTGGLSGGMGSNNTFVSSILEKVTATISNIKNSIRSAKEFDELNQLTDRELRDIGINRGDIARIVYNENN